jgi:hypothetical protein
LSSAHYKVAVSAINRPAKEIPVVTVEGLAWLEVRLMAGANALHAIVCAGDFVQFFRIFICVREKNILELG